MKVIDWIYNHPKEILMCCAISFIVVLIILGFFERQEQSDLKEGLVFYYSFDCCQKQVPVPVCDFEEGYWGFKVVCSDDFFGWKNSDKVIDQHFHRTLESCEEGLKFYMSYEN